MMKQHSKNTQLVIAGMLLLALLAPSFAFAETSTPRGEKQTRGNFCTTIDQVATKVSGNIAERDSHYKEKRNDRRGKIDERFSARDIDRTDNRSDWDTHRDEWQTKLTARASTTAQKAAVAKFVATINTAIATRRTAVDAAVNTYRTGLNAAVLARQTAVDAAIAALKTDTDLALAKAKADCAQNVTPKTVRDAYAASMKAAREKFQQTTKALDARKDTLKPLADARKKAIEDAVKNFNIAVEKAKLELKSTMASS